MTVAAKNWGRAEVSEADDVIAHEAQVPDCGVGGIQVFKRFRDRNEEDSPG